jgi:hypothetical protein
MCRTKSSRIIDESRTVCARRGIEPGLNQLRPSDFGIASAVIPLKTAKNSLPTCAPLP